MSKVLLIEDDPIMAASVKDFLEAQLHVVDVIGNGADGLHMLKCYGYDIAIIDWELPDIDGTQVIKEYREHGGMIPILVLTGRGLLIDKEAGLDSGADDYLTKPFEMRELAARLRALVRRPVARRLPILTIGNIELNTITRRVRSKSNEREINLRPKEFALLEYLINNPDRILTNDEIMDRLWRSDEDRVSDALRSHVTRLRRKIEAVDDTFTIESVYGQGYRLLSPGKFPVKE